MRRPTLSLPSVVPLGLALLTLLAWAFTGNMVAGAALVPLAAMLTLTLVARVLAGALRVQVRRQVNAVEIEFGQVFTQRLTLELPTHMSRLIARMLPIEVVDTHTLPGMIGGGLAVAVGVDRLGEERTTICLRRGVFQQGATEVVVRTPMGFFVRRRVVAPALDVLVYPAILPLTRLAFSFDGPRPGGMATVRERHGRPRPPAVVGLRRYEDGDPLDLVDWPTFALTGERWTLRFAQPTAARTWVVVDATDAEALAADGKSNRIQSDTVELSIIAAGSIACYLIGQAEGGVSLLTGANGPVARQMEPLEHAAARQRVKRQLALLAPPPAEALTRQLSDLEDVIHTRGVSGGQSTLILVSPAPVRWCSQVERFRALGMRVGIVQVGMNRDVSRAERQRPIADVTLAVAGAASEHFGEMVRQLEGYGVSTTPQRAATEGSKTHATPAR